MKNLTSIKRVLRASVVTAAILSMVGVDAAYATSLNPGGNRDNDNQTVSPIKHVIIILGENRTFDHIFGTYTPKAGETVSNLLSKKIINVDGSAGPNYALSKQYSASDTTTYRLAPNGKVPYDNLTNKLQAPGTSYAPQAPYTSVNMAATNGPGAVANRALAQQAEYGLDPYDLRLLLTGATGLPGNSPDTRISSYNNLPNGVYPLSPKPGYDAYAGSPVHRFFQMWQQLDCDIKHASTTNPTGCLADLFSWVEQTISSGSNGGAPHALAEGDIAMGFYNMAAGDAPYFKTLADEYTLSDNYHQPVMGGTFANHMMLAYGDALFYADANGAPAVPNHVLVPGSNPPQYVNEIANPNPLAGTNNWYTNDGYSGGSYTNCSDWSQPGVLAIAHYLKTVGVKPNCRENAYYLLNNYVPSYIGSGKTDPINNGPFTLPPVKDQRHIGDVLSKARVSWAYFGERWNDFVNAPGLGANYGSIDPPAYLYCNICNPFLYSASVMTNPVARVEHNQDLTDFYDSLTTETLPAVSFIKPSTFSDGHPSSSKFDIFEAFTKKIIQKVHANPTLWATTAIFVTVDEGGGYYDSGYVQPVDFFGDGTRIPLLVVSKYSLGGHVSHEYADHVSITKFIERNWKLSSISPHTRDALPNPIVASSNPYVPLNRPAIGDLWSLFSFGK